MLYTPPTSSDDNTESSDNAAIAYAWKIAKDNFCKSLVFDLPLTVLMGVADSIGLLKAAEYSITGNNYAYSQPITYSGIVKHVALNVFTGTMAFSIRAIGRDFNDSSKAYAAGFVAGSMKYSLKSAWNGGSILLPGIVGGHNNMFYELNNDHTPESMQYYSSPIIEGIEGFIMGFKRGCQKDPVHCFSSGLKQGIFEGVLGAGIGWFLTELGGRVYASTAAVPADAAVGEQTATAYPMIAADKPSALPYYEYEMSYANQSYADNAWYHYEFCPSIANT